MIDAAYVAAREGCSESAIRLTALGGGVSNRVFLVEAPARRYILKQSLAKLNVAEAWYARRDRIFREAEALRLLAPLLPAGSIPEVLYEDRENYAFAMSVAPGRESWKERLLAGETDGRVADSAGRIHRAMIDATPRIAAAFADLEVFEQLRLDPYYKFTASRHPDLAERFGEAAARCRQPRAVTHGDWSPKNLMIDTGRVTAIDFEVIHYGDPAFDAAFLLNHLVLKSFHRPELSADYRALAGAYWRALDPDAGIEQGVRLHLPLLLLARMDGKSPAEYIREEPLRERIRNFARRACAERMEVWELFEAISSRAAWQ